MALADLPALCDGTKRSKTLGAVSIILPTRSWPSRPQATKYYGAHDLRISTEYRASCCIQGSLWPENMHRFIRGIGQGINPR